MARLISKSNQDRPSQPFPLPWRHLARSWSRRALHGLPEALISLVAILVFGGLFIHVFRDVFSADMAALTPGTVRGAQTMSCLILAAGGALIVHRMVRDDVTLGWGEFSRASGLNDASVLIFDRVSRLVLATLVGLVTAAVIWFLAPDSWIVRILGILGAGACFLAAVSAARSRGAGRTSAVWSPFPLVSRSHVASRWRVLIRWRFGLLVRAPSTWVFWTFAGLTGAGSYALAAAPGIPAAFVAILAWLAGWIATLPVSVQAAAENATVHFEESLGVTRVEIAHSHAGTCAIIGTLCGLTVAATCIVTGRTESIAQCAAAAVMAPSLMPALLWQIDVRRPVIQWLTSLMASLFLATAIVATKVAFLLWPAVLILLFQHQTKRLRATSPGEFR